MPLRRKCLETYFVGSDNSMGRNQGCCSHSTIQRIGPHNKGLYGPNGSGAKSKKSCYKLSIPAFIIALVTFNIEILLFLSCSFK